MEDCIFCKIVRGEVPAEKVWEGEDYLAFLDINPINPGHTVLIPKKHSDYLFDLGNKEYKELLLRAKKIAKLLESKLNPRRVGLAVEGFMVPHVHIHLVPLEKGNELNPARAKNMDSGKLKKIADKIRA